MPTGAMSLTRIKKDNNPDKHIRTRVRYLLKGADGDTRAVFGCEKAERTHIVGKRCGFAQDLGNAARKKADAVQLSGNRKPTRELLEAAAIRDEWRARQRELFEADPMGYWKSRSGR